MKRPGEQVAVLVVDGALEERRADAVGEAAAHLTVGDQRVEQPAGVVDGRVVDHVHLAGRAVDLDDGDVDEECVCCRRATLSSSPGGSRFGAL